ncbi:MAG: DUF1501 domain-containing protein [Verrucomicrobia bacterium]|nr:DUF1501 domain-containing protein [Verrucomicrobiota bacterium]
MNPGNADLNLSRREFLARSGMGFGMLGLSGVLAEGGLLPDEQNNPLAARSPQFRARAKRIIHIFLNGGPSHVDTFDPKPLLGKYDGKELPTPNLITERQTGAAFGSPFKFERYGQSGIEISELFSHLGEHADDLCVIRSMQSELPNHEPSLMLMNCGSNALVRPSMGSWLTYGLGTENQNLPGFVAMCPGGHPIKGPDNWRSAFLPGIYEGTFVNSEHETVEKLIKNIRNPRLDPDAQRRQVDLIQALNQRHLRERGHDPQLEARIQSHEQAYRMQFAATEAFDIKREPEAVRQRYGDTVQARQLLIARRLVERGVRFVQLWHGKGQPWDNHDDIEKNHRKLAGECSQAIGALLTDLKQRGLFDETLVILGGEFGRTPTVEQKKDGASKLGRDHNPYGFSVLLAGGGVKGGTIYGATDEFGFRAVERPVHVHDLHATILHLMGFDHERLTYRYASRDFRLTDVGGKVIGGILA